MARRPALKLSRSSTSRGHGTRGARITRRSTAAVRNVNRKDSQAALKRALRRSALRDCNQRCVYCAARLDQYTATLDHVVPLARGGSHDPGNLVAACAPCNRMKGDLLPFEFFARFPWAGANFVRYARNVTRALKRGARRAVSLAFARDDDALAA